MDQEITSGSKAAAACLSHRLMHGLMRLPYASSALLRHGCLRQDSAFDPRRFTTRHDQESPRATTVTTSSLPLTHMPPMAACARRLGRKQVAWGRGPPACAARMHLRLYFYLPCFMSSSSFCCCRTCSRSCSMASDSPGATWGATLAPAPPCCCCLARPSTFAFCSASCV